MTTIHTYLTFNGNCREAMTFYRECLGGKLILQTIGESPASLSIPACMRSLILHSSLTKGSLVINGTDMVPESGLTTGNAVSLLLNCSTEREARVFYAKLSTDGVATHPLESTFWGALFGGLTDKYGTHWLINFEGNSRQ
ncbi:VOC family protein [Chitinophaga polysaccharea]|uniref:VOC family protein n=1 Tax=Chitinophaga TaxID=79328 RepID=UPI0014552888|nr:MULTISPECIES: VOC family protein [Chitinophaga]NLR59121.1 VOC family protein [Chitinophaga polysaccharea]NLU92108.1 VOC family protein [Chitinophaga sp. Ak27]